MNKNIIKKAIICTLLIGFLTGCGVFSKNDKDNSEGILLLLLGAQNRRGDGCNLKTNFAICIPPGIAGN